MGQIRTQNHILLYLHRHFGILCITLNKQTKQNGLGCPMGSRKRGSRQVGTGRKISLHLIQKDFYLFELSEWIIYLSNYLLLIYLIIYINLSWNFQRKDVSSWTVTSGWRVGGGKKKRTIGRLFKHFHLNLPESCCPETFLCHPSRLCWLLPSVRSSESVQVQYLWTSRYSGTSSNCKGNPWSSRAPGTLPHLRVLCLFT